MFPFHAARENQRRGNLRIPAHVIRIGNHAKSQHGTNRAARRVGAKQLSPRTLPEPKGQALYFDLAARADDGSYR